MEWGADRLLNARLHELLDSLVVLIALQRLHL